MVNILKHNSTRLQRNIRYLANILMKIIHVRDLLREIFDSRQICGQCGQLGTTELIARFELFRPAEKELFR